MDLSSLKLPDTPVKQKSPESSSLPPKHSKGEKFLRGPIPWDWIKIASSLPGMALHVGIALWHLAGFDNCAIVKLSGKLLRGMGVERHSGYRGLKQLEEGKLVAVKRHRGRNPEVTILDATRENVITEEEKGGDYDASVQG